MNCHRIHVNLLDTSSKDKAMALFISMRFAHEGRRRRAFFSILESEWKDTTSLAILDTDWMVRSKFLTKPTPTTLWDEMLLRHDRERQQLMRWEDDQTQSWPTWLKRTSSMETIRMAISGPLSDYKDTSDDSAASSEVEDGNNSSSSKILPLSIRKGKGKGKRNIDRAASPSDPFDTSYPSSDSENDAAYPPPRKSLRFGSPSHTDHRGTDEFFDFGYTLDSNINSSDYPPFPRASSTSPPLSVATAPSPSPSVSSESDHGLFISARSRSRSRFFSLESASSNDSQSDAGAQSDNDGYASSTPSSSSQWDMIEAETGSVSAASPTSTGSFSVIDDLD
jgi:hypothetical protein